jgi:alpha-ketoglutaric semialdehyde dehydrogenase
VTGKNSVGFKLSALGDDSFQTFNPVTKSYNETFFSEAVSQEIDEAVLLASNAFEELKGISNFKRAAFLEQIAEKLKENQDLILGQYLLETGLPIDRAQLEFKRTIFQLTSFSELVKENNWREPSIDEADNSRIPVKPDLRKMLFGIGPVVVFGASNFPLAYSTIGGDSVAALAAGCSVIVKSHPLHAGTGELVTKCVIEAAKETEMPNGIFSNLNAQGFEVGTALVKHPLIKAVGFTGSITGGRALFDLANQRPEPIPVFAEMGSVNPVVLLPDSLVEKIDEWSTLYADSIMASCGQFCTQPGLLFCVKSNTSDAFIEQLTKKVLQKSPQTMLHPSIHSSFNRSKAERLSVEGLHFFEKEETIDSTLGRPTIAVVSGKHFQNNPSLEEEVFGPFSIVVECESVDEVRACLTNLNGQLTATVMGSVGEIKSNTNLIQVLQNKVGRIIFNGVPTGVDVCPSMNHGGPYPASTDSRYTAVGIDSIKRFARPIAFQNCPDELLPDELKHSNPLNLVRREN